MRVFSQSGRHLKRMCDFFFPPRVNYLKLLNQCILNWLKANNNDNNNTCLSAAYFLYMAIRHWLAKPNKRA